MCSIYKSDIIQRLIYEIIDSKQINETAANDDKLSNKLYASMPRPRLLHSILKAMRWEKIRVMSGNRCLFIYLHLLVSLMRNGKETDC